MTSPTQRTLAALKADPAVLHAQVVEHWIAVPSMPAGGVRRDLFTILDLVALEKGVSPDEVKTVGIQVCAAPSLSARQAKIEAAPALLDLWRAGWAIRVHGWRKVGPRGKMKRWKCLVREIQRTADGWTWKEIAA